MGAIADEDIVRIYHFWLFQYTIRNSIFSERVNDLISAENKYGDLICKAVSATPDKKNKQEKKCGIIAGLGSIFSKFIDNDEYYDEYTFFSLKKIDLECQYGFPYSSIKFYSLTSDDIIKSILNDTFHTLHAPCENVFIKKGRFLIYAYTDGVATNIKSKKATALIEEHISAIIGIDLRKSTEFLMLEFQQLVDGLKEAQKTGKPYNHRANRESLDSPARYKELATAIKRNNKCRFVPDRPEPRAAGLWLWDYIKNNNVPLAKAYRAFKESCPLHQLGYAASEVDTFRNIYRSTKSCIESCEVIPFK